MRMQLLGGLSGEKFLSQSWEKRPLLGRNAITNLKGMLQAPELSALSLRDDVESRLVCRRRGACHMQQGPFSRTQIARLPKSGWTLLVQGLNLELPEADALLRRFRFLPYARLDDVMVSYAAAGGGVGPHFDSYDVFLLQGPGRRRWRVGRPREPQLDPKSPLRILTNFRPESEWLLEPGDMLYLPPAWARHGLALEPSCTYSIRFPAPLHQEVAREFLAFLQDHVALEGTYADRGAKPARRPAEVRKRMAQHAAAVVRRIRWSDRDVEVFVGEYLSVPTPQTVLSRPRSPRS